MTWTIRKPRSTWITQARDAWAALEPHASKGTELRALADLRPIGEVLGMPDRGDACRNAGGDARGLVGEIRDGHR